MRSYTLKSLKWQNWSITGGDRWKRLLVFINFINTVLIIVNIVIIVEWPFLNKIKYLLRLNILLLSNLFWSATNCNFLDKIVFRPLKELWNSKVFVCWQQGHLELILSHSNLVEFINFALLLTVHPKALH